MVFRLGLLATLLLALASSSGAAPVLDTGGSFDDPGGWRTVENHGSVSIQGGEATLSTGTGTFGPFSAVLIIGNDGTCSFASSIVLPIGTTFLSFEVVFEGLAPDLLEPGLGTFTDNLGVNLHDALDPTLDLVGGAGHLVVWTPTGSSSGRSMSGLRSLRICRPFSSVSPRAAGCGPPTTRAAWAQS